MKTLLMVSALQQLVVGSLAAVSLSIVASDEWTPFDFPGLADLVKLRNGGVVEASRAAARKLFVQISAEAAVDVFGRAQEGSDWKWGGEIVGKELQSLFGLPGYSVTSRVGEVHGRTYVLFTSDHVVTVSLQRAGKPADRSLDRWQTELAASIALREQRSRSNPGLTY